ncbi:MAG: hypothetical protein IJ852_01790 [Alphaproteobacteria bacterium]|nr:hypothetical protein [Alphaproteobacteria bacterium]
MRTIGFILPLMLIISWTNGYAGGVREQEFKTKHYIEGETLFPSDFDYAKLDEALRQYYHDEKDSDSKIQDFKNYLQNDMRTPDLYDQDLYHPLVKPIFYEVSDTESMRRIGLDSADLAALKKLYPSEQENQNYRNLMARMGENVYMWAPYIFGGCGMSICEALLFVRENGKWRISSSEIGTNGIYQPMEARSGQRYQNLHVRNHLGLVLSGDVYAKYRFLYDTVQRFYDVQNDYLAQFIKNDEAIDQKKQKHKQRLEKLGIEK